jgi:hypothetical protein
VRELCYKARELLIEEGNVVGVDAPVTVSIQCLYSLNIANDIRYVEIFTASSMISWSCFVLVVTYRTRIICSWV